MKKRFLVYFLALAFPAVVYAATTASLQSEDGTAISESNPLKVTCVSGCSGGDSGWTDSGTTINLTTSTDNVGIGTDSPSGRLGVWGNGTTTGVNTMWRDSAGTAKITILDNGNLGIGTTVPSAKLELLGAGTTSATNAVSIKSSAGTSRLVIEDGGNVGIGTSSPQTIFHMNQPTSASVAAKGILISGDEVYQTGNGTASTGVRLATGVNRASNRQLWIGDTAAYGSASLGLLRIGTGGTTVTLSGVTGDGITALPLGLTANVGIGSSSPVSALDILDASTTTAALNTFNVIQNWTPSGNTASRHRGAFLQANTAGSANLTDSLFGVSGLGFQGVHGGTGTATGVAGVEGVVRKSSTGIITNAYAFYGQHRNENASNAITNAYGFYLDSPFTTGPITNRWGVYIADTGANNYFASNVGIGTTAPREALEVNGTIRPTGYKSSDGTAGVTVTTCTGFKNGLCISGT